MNKYDSNSNLSIKPNETNRNVPAAPRAKKIEVVDGNDEGRYSFLDEMEKPFYVYIKDEAALILGFIPIFHAGINAMALNEKKTLGQMVDPIWWSGLNMPVRGRYGEIFSDEVAKGYLPIKRISKPGVHPAVYQKIPETE